ncbi:hypothetical protein DIS24_g8121 [Lasiodiplodia hormozganensis]|uniref:Uncharacterized protein n=1 Tax=Lasiodiplodia hormozganensis TaxID=869390 RepID=A0AA39Y5F9_9PEZI|nr:hypothetical protein DIS24_g8121 [Lasiodiplodia hormozganensis]
MDFAAQDIVNYLCATTGAIPVDRPGIYLTEQDGTELIEKLWTGTETAEELVVAEDVRENTPSLFLQDGKERYAFSVDTNNKLQRHRFDKNLDEWVKDHLQGEQPILIHKTSRFSGGIVDGYVILPGTDFDDVQIVNFLVIPYEDLTFYMFALLSSGRLVVIDKIGTKTLLGQVKDGQFTAASSEECVIEAAAMVKKGIKAASGIKSKGK